MTIGELKKYLEKFPDEDNVGICTDSDNPLDYWDIGRIIGVIQYEKDQTREFVCLVSD